MKLKLKNYDMVEYDFSADEDENISDNMHYDWDLPDDLPEEPDLYAEFRREIRNMQPDTEDSFRHFVQKK